MRNATVSLTDAQFAIAQSAANDLVVSETVTMEYTKRDGTTSSAIGTVTEVKLTNDSTAFVKVDTSRGPRTINLYNVLTIGGKVIV